jgi:hypothetical protein
MHHRPDHIDHEWRTTHLQLLLLSHGGVTNWAPTTSGTRDRDPRPTGDSNPIADHYAWMYANAAGDVSRQRVIHEAREELARWRGHGITRAPGETQAAKDARMVREGEGWTVDEVARHFQCTGTHVRQVCRQHEVEIDYRGVLCRSGAVSRASMAASLRDAGSSQQEIAAALGVHQSQVSRLIGTRRKAA